MKLFNIHQSEIVHIITRHTPFNSKYSGLHKHTCQHTKTH